MKPLQTFKMHLAKYYAKLYPRDMFIAVAGSIDRNAATEAAAMVLSQKYKTIVVKPGELLRLNPSIKKVVLDLVVERNEDVDFYLSLVKPKTAIFTKSGINEILQETGKLIESLDEDGVALINWDDPNSRKLAQDCRGKVIYYGVDPQNCTIWAGNIKIENFKTTFELNLGVERVKVNSKLLGLQWVFPALAAACLGVVYDIPLTRIKKALESIEPMEHSMQIITGPNGSVLLDDTLNSSFASVDSAIDTLLQLPARRRVVCLGEMRGLGKYSENLHRQVAQRIFKEKLDLVFLGQGETQFIADELKSLGFWEDRIDTNLQNSHLVSKLLKILDRGDVCLIKGAREIRLDEVVKRISKK